jgi:RNA polymerase sigma factor (TIGR02999 family)
MARENPGQTLQPTALLHEAYLRLVGESREEPWRGRRQFFAAAAEAMRRILVEKAREKKSLKRGGDLQRHPLENVQIEARRPPEEILALHEALNRLAEIDPAKADLVKLRYFVGMTIAEAAEVLEISPSSVDRLWAYARAWLHQEMTKGDRSV